MEDCFIIDLYWQRSERAIAETEKKYGGFCYSIAYNILSVREDSEECVNDTWHSTWNAIPPQRPTSFRAWLGRITRNKALDLWNKKHRQKRYSGGDELLSELEDCIPSPVTVESRIEAKELTRHIEEWLRALPREDRILFLRRYWNGQPLSDLAREMGISPEKLASRMYRLRWSLKDALKKEGVYL